MAKANVWKKLQKKNAGEWLYNVITDIFTFSTSKNFVTMKSLLHVIFE